MREGNKNEPRTSGDARDLLLGASQVNPLSSWLRRVTARNIMGWRWDESSCRLFTMAQAS